MDFARRKIKTHASAETHWFLFRFWAFPDGSTVRKNQLQQTNRLKEIKAVSFTKEPFLNRFFSLPPKRRHNWLFVDIT